MRDEALYRHTVGIRARDQKPNPTSLLNPLTKKPLPHGNNRQSWSSNEDIFCALCQLIHRIEVIPPAQASAGSTLSRAALKSSFQLISQSICIINRLCQERFKSTLQTSFQLSHSKWTSVIHNTTDMSKIEGDIINVLG